MTTRQDAESPREDPIVAALAGETVTYANPLATVTRNCIVVRDAVRGAHTILLIDSLTGLRKLATTLPALLVVAGGIFTIAAAAFVSKQGMETVVPMALVGLLFVMGYLGTRRAAVLFLTQSESVQSIKGSYREAAALVRAVEAMRTAAAQAQSASNDA
jgi:hypothetical protein